MNTQSSSTTAKASFAGPQSWSSESIEAFPFTNINLQHNKAHYYRVPGFGYHHAWRTLPMAGRVISMDPDGSKQTICQESACHLP